MHSLAAGSRVVQATLVPSALSTSYAGAREGEQLEGEVRVVLRGLRAAREEASALNGLSCGAYLSAGRLRTSGRVVEHRNSWGLWEAPKGGRRRGITCWSKSSRRRLRTMFQRVLWEKGGRRWLVATLTLPGRDTAVQMDGRVVHRYRRAFLKRWWRKFGQGDYAWKLEFQRRGAAHFAVILPLPSASDQQPYDLTVLQAWVAQAWFEVVGSGSLAHLHAGTQVQVIRDSKRLCSYLSGEFVKGGKNKEYQHIVPADYVNVGRWWGVSRGLMEPWSEWMHDEPTAYRVRRAVVKLARSKWARGRCERARRKRPSSMTVYTRGDALLLGWQLNRLRQ